MPLATSAPALSIDDNADGTVDRTVNAQPAVTGAAAGDLTAPTMTVSVEPYTDSNSAPRVRVQVTATDETDGSGVDRIEWLHTGAGTPVFNRYADVLDLPATGDVYLRTIDRA